jgi:hypothetical protein
MLAFVRFSLLTGCFLLLAGAACGEEPNAKQAAKDIVKKYQDALVTVKFVLKIGTNEVRHEIEGTVISPAGLTVVSNLMSNPFAALADGDSETKAETTDVKLTFRDGREFPAKFVLRDTDLDLAFVLPKEKDQKFTHVPLSKAPVPELLDDLLVLHRLGRNLNREPSISLAHVGAVVKKPQTLVVPDSLSAPQSVGCPAFDSAGRMIGIVVIRRSTGGGRDAHKSLDLAGMLRPVILPTEDLEQTASQVGKP